MYAPKVKSNRQQAKEKAKVLKGKVTIVISGLEIMGKFPLIVQTSSFWSNGRSMMRKMVMTYWMCFQPKLL